MINYIWMSFKAYLSCYHLLYTQAHSHVGLWVLWPSFYGPQSPQVQLGPNLVKVLFVPYLPLADINHIVYDVVWRDRVTDAAC